ncbi:hypothetical protein J6590_053970 [Homalodisca vitripennis]|nr:hypothetical protein J6590_053970 [Homalodisca vitripennis]
MVCPPSPRAGAVQGRGPERLICGKSGPGHRTSVSLFRLSPYWKITVVNNTRAQGATMLGTALGRFQQIQSYKKKSFQGEAANFGVPSRIKLNSNKGTCSELDVDRISVKCLEFEELTKNMKSSPFIVDIL